MAAALTRIRYERVGPVAPAGAVVERSVRMSQLQSGPPLAVQVCYPTLTMDYERKIFKQ